MFQTSRKHDLPKLISGCYDSFTSRLSHMTEEERQRAMDFIVESLAGLTVNDQKQNARLDKVIQTLERDERLLKMIIRAGRRERKTRSEADERLKIAQAELTQAQKVTEYSIAHTDSKLDALVDIVRQRLNGS